MNVTIQERKFTLASEYDISAPGRNFHARKRILALTDHLTLESEDGKTRVQIDGEFSPVRSKHVFRFSGGKTYAFECEKLWRRVFTCAGEGKTYHLYEHRGLKYSIFQNDQQIAAFEKNRIVLGKGNEYQIRMNADADLLVIVCMVLTINSKEYDGDDSSVTIDLGNPGPQERPFDESWEPKG